MSSTTGKPIMCKAAVAWAAKEPFKMETIRVDPPKCGEVRIKLMATAVCHTDAYTWSGQDPEGLFPCVLGHEGAGVIESVGPGVHDLSVGDHVVPLYVPQCRECEYCKNPKTNLCQKIRVTQGQGLMPDGTSRLWTADGGKMLYHFMGCSTFAQYCVLPTISVCKVDEKAPFERACLLGCGVTTGYGAAMNTAKVEAGSTVAVWGLGAVGLAVGLGAKKCGARRIIGVDVNEEKFERAKVFGFTEFVNPMKHEQPVQQVLVAMTDGGLDYTFECIGNVNTMRAALEACHKGWGVSTILGVAASGEEIRTRPFQLVTGRVWQGSAFGGYKSRDSVPKLVGDYMNGSLLLDEFVTHTMQIEEVNEAFELMKQGKSLRTVLKFD